MGPGVLREGEEAQFFGSQGLGEARNGEGTGMEREIATVMAKLVY